MSIGKKGSLARRVAAAVGALAVGVMGLAGAALTANATDTGNNIIVPPNAGSETTLTIHKYSGVQGDAGDGTATPPTNPDNKPLKGVVFTVTPITHKGSDPIDLDTPEGWDIVNPVVNGARTPITADQVLDAKNGFVQGKGTPLPATGDYGSTGAQPFAHGLYLVTETDWSNATDPATGKHVTVTSHVAPFLVTLPLPKVAADGGTNGTWIYDVNVYPKNQLLDAPTKTINSSDTQTGVKLGDTVEYTISQKVPAKNAKDTYTRALIYDRLDPTQLAYAGTTSVNVKGTPLDPNDYIIAADGSSWEIKDPTTLNPGDVITVVFTAKVLSVTSTGAIENGPGNNEPGKPGYGSIFNNEPPTPGTTTPYTYWGQLKVTKVVQGNTSKKLKDAEFTVGKTVNGACPASAPADTDTATFVAKGTSNDDGIVKWKVNDPETAQPAPNGLLGLFVANSDTDLGNNVDPKDYCLYETKAPAGYILVNDVKTVKIHAGTANLVTGYNDITVDNQQQDHPNLPLTGAAGTVVMTLGGIALVAAGGAAYAVSRKRSAR